MNFSDGLAVADFISEKVIPVVLVAAFGFWCGYMLLRGIGHGKG